MQLTPQLIAALTDVLAPELRGSCNLPKQLAARLRTAAAALDRSAVAAQPVSTAACQPPERDEVVGPHSVHSLGSPPATEIQQGTVNTSTKRSRRSQGDSIGTIL